ncbi:MAG: hypothetical protein LBF42_01685 [Puniceicoccales bacterium]|jgi:hypothetical protein|nr:hypothetical protein [Puniceicoccales bacterium]
MVSDGLLEKFQSSVEKYLRELNDFRGTPILTYKQSDINSVVRSAINGGIGVAILILPPGPAEVVPNAAGPVFEKVICKIQVIENLATNKTGRSAIFIAEKIMQYLHLWQSKVSDWNEELTLSADHPWQTTQESDTNVITLQFETNCSLKSA